MTSIAYRVYDGDECVADADADASYAYDGLGRLVSEAASQSGSEAFTQFSYDLAGNRLSVSSASSAVSSTFTHNRMDGILHDAAGNVTNYARNGVSYDLAWNTQGQLLSVSTNGVLAESYTWDPFGRRSSTTEHTEHTETTTFHVYDGNECVADVDASGNPLRTYTWGQGIDDLLAVTVYACQPNSPQPAASSYYAVKDHLGSVHALVDASGQLAASYTYDAWGNVQSAVGNGQSAVLSRFLFQGREYSFATGLTNFRARWYDPATGRWLSKDPIGLEGGLNLYEFCGDDPVNYRDPWGFAWITVHVDDRTSGSGSSGSAGSNSGHGWTTITYDSGASVTIGNYPGGPRNDAARQPTASQSFYVTDAQAAAAQTAASRPGYNFFADNCVDRVEDALNAAGIQHPSFNTLGVSDPARLMDWLQPQTPAVPVPQSTEQSQCPKWNTSTECK